MFENKNKPNTQMASYENEPAPSAPPMPQLTVNDAEEGRRPSHPILKSFKNWINKMKRHGLTMLPPWSDDQLSNDPHFEQHTPGDEMMKDYLMKCALHYCMLAVFGRPENRPEWERRMNLVLKCLDLDILVGQRPMSVRKILLQKCYH